MLKKFCRLINYILIIVVMIIVVSTAVYAATSILSSDTYYDNSSSGLNSTNVQDALDELYNKANNLAMVGVDGLAKHITDLYIDSSKTTVTNNSIKYNYATSVKLMNDRHGGTTSSLDGGNIRYYGADPDNYIYFNCDDYSNQSSSTCEIWRIIGVFDGKVKIMRNDSIGDLAWDLDKNEDSSLTTYNNNWNTSSLSYFLNGLYYNRGETETINYYSNSSGGTVTNVNLVDIGINDNTRKLIETNIWNLRTFANSSTTSSYTYSDGMYKAEKDTGVMYDSLWNSKNINNIALLYASDYGYAADLSSCNQQLYYYDDSSCMDINWISDIAVIDSKQTWLLTHQANNNIRAWCIGSTGRVSANCLVTYNPCPVFPVLYLKYSVGKKAGDGSVDNPYQLLVS